MAMKPPLFKELIEKVKNPSVWFFAVYHLTNEISDFLAVPEQSFCAPVQGPRNAIRRLHLLNF